MGIESKAKLNADGKYACKPFGDYDCKYYREPDIKGKIGQYCLFVNKNGICNNQDAIKETKRLAAEAKKAADDANKAEAAAKE